MDVEKHLKIVENALQKKVKTQYVAMGVNMETLAELTGKTSTVNFKYAYYLSNILNRIIDQGFETMWDDELGLGVWINHKNYLKQIKFMSISPDTLTNDFAILRKSGILKSKRESKKMLHREFYFIDTNSIHIFHKSYLTKYKNKLSNL
jgi:hypothetical protein